MFDVKELQKKTVTRGINAPVNRLTTEFFGRTYPTSHRHPELPEPELPDHFRNMPEEIAAGLPFYALKDGASKEALYDANEASLTLLSQMYNDAGELFANIVRGNMEVRGEWTKDKVKFDLMQQKMSEWKGKLPQFAMKRPATLSLELHSQAEFVIRSQLDFTLRELSHSLVRKLFLGLDYMVDMEQVGLIEWVCSDGCRFHFYRNIMISETGESRFSTETDDYLTTDGRKGRLTKNRIERDSTIQHRHARHVHDVVNAKNYMLNAASAVPRPERVDLLIAKLPLWLTPHARIVDGMEVRRQIVERDLKSEKLTDVEESSSVWEEPVTVIDEPMFHYDPALTIGYYVIAGWGADETDQTKLPAKFKVKALPPKKGD